MSEHKKYGILFSNELKKLRDIVNKENVLTHEKNYCIIRTASMLEEVIKKITVLIYKDYGIQINNSTELDLKATYDDFKNLQNNNIDFEELYFENSLFLSNPIKFESKFEKLFRIKIFYVLKFCSINNLNYFPILKMLNDERNKMAHELTDTNWDSKAISQNISLIENFFKDYMILLHSYFSLVTWNKDFKKFIDKKNKSLSKNELNIIDKKINELLREVFRKNSKND